MLAKNRNSKRYNKDRSVKKMAQLLGVGNALVVLFIGVSVSASFFFVNSESKKYSNIYTKSVIASKNLQVELLEGFYTSSKDQTKILSLVDSVKTLAAINSGIQDEIAEVEKDIQALISVLEANRSANESSRGEVDVAFSKSLESMKKLNQAALIGQGAQDRSLATVIRWALIIVISGTIIAPILNLLIGHLFGKTIVNSLRSVIVGLSTASSDINNHSNSFSESSQMLAESSSEQAQSIKETSSSVEEIANQIKKNNENTTSAEHAMKKSRELVETGMGVIKRLTEAMKEILDASNETSKIIKTIDDIAFQTNLLALNAAVEAARAGEAGKGFAVVAEEVRTLAQRSAVAARNTSDLIQRSQHSTEQGVNYADAVVQNLELISESAGNVDAMVTEISNSSHDQATGIDQMTNALSEMEIVVQDTASISEESASSAIELERQAKDMQEIMELLVTMVGDESLLSKDEGNIGFKKTKPAKKAKFPEMSPNMSAGYENDFSLDYDEDEPELITDYS